MTEHVVVEADGGSRGNPGPAGCGAVIRDAGTGDVLVERQERLGHTTNNVAEYRGLILGLTAAADLGAQSVDVRMDSKLVVEQMCGRWKVKHAGLQPLAAHAREVAAGFRHVRYEWMSRERNTHADRLANAAMDGPIEEASEDTTEGSGDHSPVGNQQELEFPQESGPGHTPRAAAGSTGTEQAAVTSWSGATGTATRLLLLRHGQTELSVDRRYSGRGDVPLTENGTVQVEAAAKRLAASDALHELDQVPLISSPLTRARQSAQAIADVFGSRVETHPGLVEADFGAWEGLTFAQAAQRDPELHRTWLGDSSVRPPDGESFDEVFERVGRVRDELVERYLGRTVVVISHVAPLKTFLRLGLNAGLSLLFRLHLDLASLSIVDFYADGHTSVRLVNDTSHLV